MLRVRSSVISTSFNTVTAFSRLCYSSTSQSSSPLKSSDFPNGSGAKSPASSSHSSSQQQQQSVASESSPSSSSPLSSHYSERKSKLSLNELNSYIEHNIGSYNHISSFSDLPLEFGYNQHISIDNELRERLRALLWKFNAPIKYAFAYGSGVFSQGRASDAKKPQIDLVFGVSYSQHWHSLNMRQYPEHYSSLKYLGSGAVSFVQEKLGAGLYFNPYVEMDGLKIKYGVVNIDTVLGDLEKWQTLYLAGRLHKPVKILRDEPRVRFVNQSNLISALRTALLILPENFTELDLYKTVAGISYMGDPRMTVGENPNKINNIVNNQFLNFRNLYSSLLDLLPNVELTHSSVEKLPGTEIPIAALRQDMNPIKRGNMVSRLPSDFRKRLYSKYGSGELDSKEIAVDPQLTQNVSKAIRSTVGWPSFTQSVKGVLTAGVGRSVKYASEKLQKSRMK